MVASLAEIAGDKSLTQKDIDRAFSEIWKTVSPEQYANFLAEVKKQEDKQLNDAIEASLAEHKPENWSNEE